MERDCCEFICDAPTTFQGYGIEWKKIEQSNTDCVVLCQANDAKLTQIDVKDASFMQRNFYRYFLAVSMFFVSILQKSYIFILKF